jgi:hypothetical protein
MFLTTCSSGRFKKYSTDSEKQMIKRHRECPSLGFSGDIDERMRESGRAEPVKRVPSPLHTYATGNKNTDKVMDPAPLQAVVGGDLADMKRAAQNSLESADNIAN